MTAGTGGPTLLRPDEGHRAIKLIHPLAASAIGPEAAKRFEREAQAIASLRSPSKASMPS
jgi:hypothetical protein